MHTIRLGVAVVLTALALPLRAEIRPDPACPATELPLAITASSESRLELDLVARDERLPCVPGYQRWAAPGEPAVPVTEVILRVPAGTKPELSAREQVTETLALAVPLPLAPRAAVHGAGRHAVAAAEERGAAPAEIAEVGFAGSERLAKLRLWPLHYHAGDRSARIRRQTHLSIRFVADRAPAHAPLVAGATDLSRYLAINPLPGRPLAATPGVDLLIAHVDHQSAIARYVYYKQLSGREVREYYVKGKTAQEIKDIIRKEYASPVPPTSTFLVGNLDQIPAWRGSSDNTWTDFDYTELSGDGLPDLSLGRVPARDIDELNAFINKAIARETEARKVGDVLLTSGRDTSFGCPANVVQVGRNIAAADGVTLIRKLRTEVGTDEVIRAYDESPNLIVYDGHGDRDGMEEIPLLIDDLSKLTNTAFPLILDIACLNANWAGRSRNFAESILLEPDHGAAGIMASGGSGDGHAFFQSIGSLMARAKTALATDPRGNEIGRIILAAKIKNDTESRTYWNYYGDPASSVWDSTMHPTTP